MVISYHDLVEDARILFQVREHLATGQEEGTEPDNFERAVEGNQKLRVEILRKAVDQPEICWCNWPYKDKRVDSMFLGIYSLRSQCEFHYKEVNTESPDDRLSTRNTETVRFSATYAKGYNVCAV